MGTDGGLWVPHLAHRMAAVDQMIKNFLLRAAVQIYLSIHVCVTKEQQSVCNLIVFCASPVFSLAFNLLENNNYKVFLLK